MAPLLVKCVLVAAVAACAMLVAQPELVGQLVHAVMGRNSNGLPAAHTSDRNVTPVEVSRLSVPCESLRDVLNKLGSLRTPLILRVEFEEGDESCASVRSPLRLHEKWTPSFLHSQLKELVGVGCHHENYFTYDQLHRPMSALPEMLRKVSQQPTKVNKTFEDFLTDAATSHSEGTASEQCPYMYFAERVDKLSQNLFESVDWNELYVHDAYEVPRVKPLVWMGTQDVTTRLHFDWSHNVHVMVQGSKRFVLYNERDLVHQLYLHPYLHPLATKAQVDPQNVDSGRFPRFLRATPFTATLSPGDLLFIPPLWAHHVTSLVPSVSVAVWSDATETLRMNDALGLGVPQELAPSTRHSLRSTMLAVLRLGARLSPDAQCDDATAFLPRLIRQRYDPLPHSTALLSREFVCPSPHDLCAHASSPEMHAVASFVDDQLVPLFAVIGSTQRQELWLGDYVEVLVSHQAGASAALSMLMCLEELRCACPDITS